MAIALSGFVANRLWPCASEDFDRISAADDFRDVELMTAPTPEDLRQRVVSDVLQVATNILVRHGEAVERIAAELMHRNDLPGEEVWAICDAVFEPLFEAAGGSLAYMWEGTTNA
jgi:hypothetical protein